MEDTNAWRVHQVRMLESDPNGRIMAGAMSGVTVRMGTRVCT